MSALNWLTSWYEEQCDGSWEHEFGIKIVSLDNPGWSITIDTSATHCVLEDTEWQLEERDDDDWYGYRVTNGAYDAAGDPTKLTFLLTVFRELLEGCGDR